MPEVLPTILAEMRMTPSSTTNYLQWGTPWVKGRAGVSSLGDMEVILDD